jgi:glutathione S-transferase
MKLLGSALSPFAVRVMLAARFKQIDLPVEPPSGGTRTAEYLARNPIGKVPVLVDGSLVLPESDVIVCYLEDRFPAPTLFPGDAAERANARLLARLLDSYSVPSFRPFLANSDPGAIATALERIDQSLGYLDHFRKDGEFMSGSAFSVADCAWIPFFHIFEQLQDGFKTWDLARKRPRLDAWWSRARASELGVFARGAMDGAIAEMFRGAALSPTLRTP